MLAAEGRFPDFLCIGAQKAGTTWLHQRLGRHPNVWLPPAKELHYFDLPINPDPNRTRARRLVQLHHVLHAQMQRGSVDLATLRWFSHFALEDREDDDWYKGLFAPAGERLAGEFTPGYDIVPESVIGEIYARKPDLRIILLLRDPVERAWSALRFYHRLKEIDLGTMTLPELQAWIDDPLNRSRGEYDRNLRAWRSAFPAEQIFLGFYWQISAEPTQLIERVCDFLGLPMDGRTLEKMEEKANASPSLPLPPVFERILARAHRGSFVELEQELPGPTRRWRERIEKALAGG